MTNSILEIRPGDILRNAHSTQERVVVSYRPDMGLIEFDDSALVGWTKAEGWIPTGRRVEPK